MMDCPHSPEGLVCTITGRHYDHGALTSTGWVFWGEPPVNLVPTSRRKGKVTSKDLISIAHKLEGRGGVRATDPATSHQAAQLRTGSQKYRLLVEYAGADDLTDEEAAQRAGLIIENRGWWQRCADLRSDGLIADTGRTRPSMVTGEARMVCEITPEGRAMLCN